MGKLHFIFSCPLYHAKRILVLVIVIKDHRRVEVRFIKARIQVNGTIVIVHHLLCLAHMVARLLPDEISGIKPVVCLQNVVADLCRLLILLLGKIPVRQIIFAVDTDPFVRLQFNRRLSLPLSFVRLFGTIITDAKKPVALCRF